MVDLVSKDNNEEAPCGYSDLSEEWDVTSFLDSLLFWGDLNVIDLNKTTVLLQNRKGTNNFPFLITSLDASVSSRWLVGTVSLGTTSWWQSDVVVPKQIGRALGSCNYLPAFVGNPH